MSMANLQISFSLFLFFTNLTYLHIVNSHIGISIYKRNPVPIIAKIKKSLNSMSKIELSKEHSNRQKVQSWLKKCLDFFSVQHNILSALLIRLQKTSSRRFQDVVKTYSRRLDQDEYIHLTHTSPENVFKTFSRRLAKTSSRHLQNIFLRRFKTSSECLQEVLQKRLEDIFKTSSRQDVWQRCLRDLFQTYHLVNPQQTLKTSSRHVLKTFSKRLQRNNFLSSKTS